MVQKVYEGWAQPRNVKGSLANVLRLMAQLLPAQAAGTQTALIASQQGLRFEAVCFACDPELMEVLR